MNFTAWNPFSTHHIEEDPAISLRPEIEDLNATPRTLVLRVELNIVLGLQDGGLLLLHLQVELRVMLGHMRLHVLVATDLTRVIGLAPLDFHTTMVALGQPEVTWGAKNQLIWGLIRYSTMYGRCQWVRLRENKSVGAMKFCPTWRCKTVPRRCPMVLGRCPT